MEVAEIINELILEKNIFNHTNVTELTQQTEK